MAHKTIMIQEDVYNMLNALKKSNQSFNDLIKELIQKSSDLKPFYGIISDDVADQIMKAIRDTKKETMTQKKIDALKDAWE